MPCASFWTNSCRFGVSQTKKVRIDAFSGHRTPTCHVRNVLTSVHLSLLKHVSNDQLPSSLVYFVINFYCGHTEVLATHSKTRRIGRPLKVFKLITYISNPLLNSLTLEEETRWGWAGPHLSFLPISWFKIRSVCRSKSRFSVSIIYPILHDLDWLQKWLLNFFFVLVNVFVLFIKLGLFDKVWNFGGQA